MIPPGVQRYELVPPVIEAMQLEWGTWNEMCEFVGVGPEEGKPKGCWLNDEGFPSDTNHANRMGLTIPTPTGVLVIRENDWVVKTTIGNIVSWAGVDPTTFAVRYQRALDK